MPSSGKKRYQDDIRLNKAQKKQWKQGDRPSAIEYWPYNDDDGLFYVPYKFERGNHDLNRPGFESSEIAHIKAAFKEFEKHTLIR